MVFTISIHPQCYRLSLQPPLKSLDLFRSPTCLAASLKSTSSGAESDGSVNSKPKRLSPRVEKEKVTEKLEKDASDTFAVTKPRKTRRGRRSEAAAVEDLVRGKLEQTFASIKDQNPEIVKDWERMMKEKVVDETGFDDSGDGAEDENESVKNSMVVEEEDPNWPLDADVGWGTRASEYFEKYPIKNVVGEDGFEIDWEGEIDTGFVKEINCLEWESFAFRPSPMVVLAFERYNRSSENWKALKELEKAAEVYWKVKDRLPPRTVKLDINIEKDLAYALKVKDCPEILFLRGSRILYREKGMRTADELVQMIAHFFFNAKKPSCMK